jgi:3-oxoacyl-[acyl-carrier protein] reductase
MIRRLEGKAALVTGAGRGLGREIAARLAREGVRVLEVTEQDYSLEDVFLVIAARGAGASAPPAAVAVAG